ncbi:MAG: hypothetical protein ABI175_21715, partial [Polyangiales bacterium]
AVGLGAHAPGPIIAIGLAGAALAAAIRALAGDSPASLTGAIVAPLMLIASLVDPSLSHGVALIRACIAIAAAGWTFVELARPTTSPLVAMLPATIAAILSPAYVALVVIAGSRLITAPWQRPRWAIGVPIAGALALVLAVIAGLAAHGSFGALGDTWIGAPRAPRGLPAVLELTAITLGPITAVAALAGLPFLARVRHAEVAVGAIVIGALLVSARSGTVDPSLVGVAVLATGLAVGRLAGMIRIAAGQAALGATLAVLVLLPPAWTVIEAGSRVSAVHASR